VTDGPTHTLDLEAIDLDVATLRVLGGPEGTGVTNIAHVPITVGTSEHAELRLSDPTVSRLHASLARVEGGIRLTDLGSKNGTWLHGCRIEAGQLAPGTRFFVGRTELEVGLVRKRAQRQRWVGPDAYGEILGGSRPMHELFATLDRLAGAELPVLILGESGTGKELVAKALHGASPRSAGPFVVVDGAALSRTLADSELFGHVRGAFTDAVRDHEGAFERAHGGTVFLDEIGELPLEVQAKLLRVLQEGTVRRVGEARVREVDVRVIAATHRDLRRAVNEGGFREDLFYRLAGVVIEVPALRARGRDVELLARAFARRLAPGDTRGEALVAEALAASSGHTWPGNVRELRAFVQRALILGDARLAVSATRTDRAAPSRVRTDLPFTEARREHVEAFEREYLAELLHECGGNVSEAARRAGLARSSLYQLASKLGL